MDKPGVEPKEQCMKHDVAAGAELRGACRRGDVALARSCLARGAPAGQRIKAGWRATALGWALIGGHEDLAEALVAAGSNPWDVAMEGHRDAWMVGAELGRAGALARMAALCKGRFGLKGAPCPVGLMAGRWGGRWTEELLVAAAAAMLPSAELNATDGWGMTPLMHAARGGSKPMAVLLLDAGADPSAAGSSGVTPLMLSSKTESGMCALLLSRGADPLAVDEAQATALHWAAKRGSAEAIAALGWGPAVTMLDIEGKSARERGGWAKAGSEALALLERAEIGWVGAASRPAGAGAPRRSL